MEGLSLITNHIDLRLDLRLVILIRSEHNSHKVRDIISRLMGGSELFLQGGSHLHMTFTHHNIVIRLREQPSHTLERQSCYNGLQFWTFFLLQDLEVSIGACLRRFIQCLHDDPNTSLVMRVLCVVSIEKCRALLFMSAREPVSDEILYLSHVHKLDVVNMSILLTFDDYVGWDAFVAHSFREGLVVAAGSVYLISHA